MRASRSRQRPVDLGGRIAASVLAFSALATAARAQTAAAGFDADAFDRYVSAAVSDWDATGLAVAVVKDGEVLFERGYGVLELGRPERVDEHTRFAIGSTTKAMTAAALGMLVDEGRIGWDDPVIDHMPGFRLHDPFVTREVTVRDLLTHRAGLGNADFLWYEQETTADEILAKARHIPPAYSLRSGFIYQNIMYLAAGAVVEAVSGVAWEDFIQTRIFDPLGMTESVPLVAATEGRSNVATPHYRVDDEVLVIRNASVDPVAPAGSVWSSVHDMSKWVIMLLEGGVASDGTRLLATETVDELFTTQVPLRPGQLYPTTALTEPTWGGYALGWFQHDYRGRKLDFHTGSIDGMVAIAGLVRDENLGVYVLGNLDHVEIRHALMYYVLDLFDPHGGAPRDWSAELEELYDGLAAQSRAARERRLATRETDTSPSRSGSDFAGTYADPLYGTVVITETDGMLHLDHGPGLKGPLEHWHHDTFLVRFDARWRGESFVTFELDATGRVASLDFGGREFARSTP
ncbi:MAG: serine hydrolase [Gemmatimonadetes bacterium]|nr:serine hydrolase [Gemmatimonadota bacterium]